MAAATQTWASSRFARAESNPIIRLRARLRAWAIDDQLLAGTTPDGNPVTLARLSRLLDVDYRARIAEALRRLVEAARRRQLSPFLAQVPLRVQEVLDSEPLILTLARELEEEEAVSPRGVILADRLIRDGASPLYWRSDIRVESEGEEESVDVAIRHARAALLLS
jgi:hypothetical protein